MKLTLKNFLCHVDSTFIIPENGFHKLSGTHGAGKSTIFAAIYYALYGKLFRKVKTPYSFGKKDCAVTLESNGIWIYRTSGKKSLTVKINGVKYIDESAQSVINSFIGMDHDEFLLSSYIVQNGSGSESILKLTPAKKLEFFEKLVYRGDAVSTFQEKLKAKKIQLDHQYSVLSGEKQAYEKQIEDFENINERVVEDPGEHSSDIKNELNQLNRKVTSLGSEMASIREAISKSETNRSLFVKLESEIESLSKEANIEVPEDVSMILEAKEKELSNIQRRIQLLKEIATLKSTITEEDETMEPLDEESLKQIEEELKVHKTIYDNCFVYEETKNEHTRVHSEIVSLFKEIKGVFGFFKKTVPSELSALKRLLGNRGLVCPCCKKKVDFVEGQLKVSEIELEGKEASREVVLKFIKRLETLSHKKDELKTKLSTLPEPQEHSYFDILEVYEEEKRKTERAKTLDSVHRKIRTFEDELSSFNVLASEETVKKQIQDIREIAFERTSALKRKSEASTKLKVLNVKLSHLRSELEDASKFGGEEKLRELEMQRERLMTKRSDLSSRLEIALRYEASTSIYEKYQNAINNLEKVENAINKVEQGLKGVKDIERKGKEARLLALYENIENINVRASIYLRELFEDPISINLVPVTPTGTQKIQIDTKINFKNNEYGDFGEFSGGETQLAELAFMLAINDAIGSRFLFLDECLNNLHQDSNVDILNYLKSKASERLILVVSHESSDGVFDSIIPV